MITYEAIVDLIEKQYREYRTIRFKIIQLESDGVSKSEIIAKVMEAKTFWNEILKAQFPKSYDYHFAYIDFAELALKISCYVSIADQIISELTSNTI